MNNIIIPPISTYFFRSTEILMKEHTGYALSITIGHALHTRIPHKKPELWNNNRASNFIVKNFSRASSHSTSPWPRGNCLPDRAEIFINFLPPDLDPSTVTHAAIHTADPAATKTSGSTLRHLPLFPFSPLSAYRLLISAGVSSSRAQTCPPCLPLTVYLASLSLLPSHLLSLLHAIAITNHVSQTVIPRLSRPTDLTNRVRGRGITLHGEFEKKWNEMEEDFCAQDQDLFLRVGSRLFPLPFEVGNVREITPRDRSGGARMIVEKKREVGGR